MTCRVTETCIRRAYTDCVEVCPVDCFHVGETMLVIDPAACIDCGVCEPECPADAIKADTEPGLAGWRTFNAKYVALWPAIAGKADPAADAAAWDGREGKLRAVFGTADPGNA